MSKIDVNDDMTDQAHHIHFIVGLQVEWNTILNIFISYFMQLF